jgi:hypothetical protein
VSAGIPERAAGTGDTGAAARGSGDVTPPSGADGTTGRRRRLLVRGADAGEAG